MNVTIGGLEVPVLLKSKRQMKDNFACFDANTETIHILSNLDVTLRRKTLAHECFHAFLFITGYNELLSDTSENFEEAMTRAFEQHCGHLLTFNADIEAWIRGEK